MQRRAEPGSSPRVLAQGERIVQGFGQQAVVQRDIGFEFETNGFYTRKTLTKAALPANLHHRPTGQSYNAWLSQLETQSKRLEKGAADEFLTHTSFGVQGDDRGIDSDGEVVTTHFPETPAGRILLQAALLEMVNMETRLKNVGIDQVATAADLAGGGLMPTRPDVFLLALAPYSGGWKGAPQITSALALKNVRPVTRDLVFDPAESATQEQLRRPGRAIMRGLQDSGTSKDPTGGFDAVSGLVSGLTRADEAVTAYRQAHPGAPSSESLKGLLTLIYSITETVASGGAQGFLKSAAALLPKTDFAALYGTLPAPDRQYYAEQNLLGQVRLAALVASAPGYASRMGQPLFNVTAAKMFEEVQGGERAWFRELSLRDWVRSMTAGDGSLFNAFVELFHGRRSRDKLTTAEFPNRPANKDVEGFGVLGPHLDTAPGTPVPAPVMELRFASKLMDLAQFQTEALKLFDYLVSVNQGNPNRIV